jgi:hypothetical protein
LGRIFSFLFVGNPAMTLNFFSAFLGALGVYFFSLNAWLLLSPITPKTGRNPNRLPLMIACLAGSLGFAFSKSYWSAALAAKGSIYILQTVLELGLLFFLQYWLRTFQKAGPRFQNRSLYFFIFLFTLGLTNHWPTLTLLIPGLGLLIFSILHLDKNHSLKSFESKTTLTALTFLTVVASLYLYLPLRSHLYPHLNFGAPFTYPRFTQSLLRMDYAKTETLFFHAPMAFSKLLEKSIYISDHFLRELNPWFALLSMIGPFPLVRQGHKPWALFLLTVLLTTLVTNLVYLAVDPIEFWHMDDHLMTADWVAALLACAGIYFLLTFLLGSFFKKPAQRLPALLGATALGLLPFFVFIQHLPLNDQKREFLYVGYGLEILKSMDKNAVYFGETDYDFFAMLYLTEVERKRPDICLLMSSFLDKNYEPGLITRQYPGRDVPVPASKGFFPRISPHLYCAFPNGAFAGFCHKQGLPFYFKPSGIPIQAFPGKASSSKESLAGSLDLFWDRYLEPEKRGSNPINGLLFEICAHPFIITANYLRMEGDFTHWDLYYDRALSLIRENPWLAQTWYDRGKGDVRMGNKKEAEKAFLTSAFQFLSAGLNAEALHALQRAQTLDPGNPALPKIITRIKSTVK